MEGSLKDKGWDKERVNTGKGMAGRQAGRHGMGWDRGRVQKNRASYLAVLALVPGMDACAGCCARRVRAWLHDMQLNAIPPSALCVRTGSEAAEVGGTTYYYLRLAACCSHCYLYQLYWASSRFCSCLLALLYQRCWLSPPTDCPALLRTNILLCPTLLG